MITSNKQKKSSRVEILIFILPLVLAVIALGIGRYNISIHNVLIILKAEIMGTTASVAPFMSTIVWQLRMPRIIMALLVGAGLSVAGATAQSVFSNPLATPDTIGVSAGAAFGAVLGILVTNNLYLIQLMSFLMGIVALLMTYKLSQLSKQQSIVMIVLSGMIVASFFSALVSLLKTIADTDTQLPSIVFWLMGSMSASNYKSLLAGMPFMTIGILTIYLLRWKLNVLQLNEDEAKSMGINVSGMRLLMIGSCALITASAVSMCGQIGWIGLLVPHLCRMIIGSNNKYLIPITISMGACFLLLIDTLARTVSPTEIPLSIITAIIGTPFFAYLIKKTGGAWG